MSIIKQKSFKVILFVIFFSILLSADFLFYLNGKFPATTYYLRELLIIAVLILLIPLIKQSRFNVNTGVITKLKGIYLAVAGIYLLFVILKVLLNFLLPTFRFGNSSDLILFNSLNSFLYGMIFSICAAALMLTTIFIVKDLIYFKRKQSSARNFNLLLLFFGFEIIYVNLSRNGIELNSKFWPFNISGEIFLYILIILMVVNSLRNSWVNYLNKKQKINCVWLGIPLLTGTIIFQVHIVRDNLLTEYSASLAAMIEYAGLFLCIYLCMGFLSLILHLPTAGIFDRKIREIESLHDLSRTLSSVFDSSKIVGMITKKAAAIINSDALWLQILNADSTRLKVVSSEYLQKNEITKLEVTPSNGLNDWIIQNRKSVLINEMSKDPRSNYLKEWNKNINSILGVPLISKKGVLGILFSGKTETFAYDEEDRALLQAFANQATFALENARLFEELLVKERFEQELKVAHDAQRQLLPKEMPRIKGIEIEAISVTANEVGGDYYDFFKVGNKLTITVGDVSGKGAKAAFYMAELKGIIESLANIYTSPKELTIQINKSLVRNLERTSFISLIYSIIDINKKELVFTRAGHCPLLYCSERNGESRFIEPPGLGLGLEYGKKFEDNLSEEKVKLQSGDVLVFYTDGVIEARNQHKMEFEQERLKELVSKNLQLSAFQIKELLVKEIQEFVGGTKSHDDLTFVVVKLL